MKATHLITVLLVEPDKAQAEAMKQILTSTTWNVQTAITAQQAISLADAQTPDVVVLELGLPAHNGIEFLHEFRSYPEWASIPAIICTQTHLNQQAAFQALGNVTYLYKPRTTLAQLKQKIESLLA